MFGFFVNHDVQSNHIIWPYFSNNISNRLNLVNYHEYITITNTEIIITYYSQSYLINNWSLIGNIKFFCEEDEFYHLSLFLPIKLPWVINGLPG